MEDLTTYFRPRVIRGKIIHIKRHLPMIKNWQPAVSIGQEVTPPDILGEGEEQVGFRTVHLAYDLGISPNLALTYLKRKIGQHIYENELLAERDDLFGFRKIMLLSPVDGILDYYDDVKGDLRIKLLPRRLKLISGVYGIVDSITADGLVLVRSQADIVYGMFGSGRRREGILRVIDSPEVLVSTPQIVKEYASQIVVGGAMVFPEALQQAMNLKIAGFISGGINAKEYRKMVGGGWNFTGKKWFDSGMSIMISEGFGAAPIGDDIFSQLQSFNNSYVILDGNQAKLILPSKSGDCIISIRKTVLPKAVDEEPRPVTSLVKLAKGLRVRIISAPYLGIQGIVDSIDQAVTTLPSGMKTYLVTINSLKQKIRVPYSNVEVIT